MGVGIGAYAALLSLLATPPVPWTHEVERLENLHEPRTKILYARATIDDSIAEGRYQYRALELARDWLKEQTDIRLIYAVGDFPVAPRSVEIAFMAGDTFISMLERQEGIEPSSSQSYIGYAQTDLHKGNVAIRKKDLKDLADCPSRYVLRIALTQIHEIGHNMGLYHPSDVFLSSIPLRDAEGRQNVMYPEIPAWLSSNLAAPICERPVSTLTSADLDLPDLDPIQRAQFRDALAEGIVWQRLRAARFDLNDYIESINAEPLPPEIQHRLDELMRRLHFFIDCSER